jgi:FkbM family methyltransferase
VIDEVFIHKAYNPRGFEIEEGDVVVDLGAHIGAFTLFAARKAGVVLSYEPEPENFAILKENVKANGLIGKVKIFKRAVWSERGFFPLHSDHNGSHIASLTNRGVKSVLVKTVTLKDIFTENKLEHIDFLKVDVEGAELQIFKSTKANILTAIKKIAVECHSPLLKKTS